MTNHTTDRFAMAATFYNVPANVQFTRTWDDLGTLREILNECVSLNTDKMGSHFICYPVPVFEVQP